MRFVVLITAFFLLLSCQTLPPTKTATVPDSFEIHGIIPVKQGHNSCVPATLAMVFNFYDHRITPDEIYNWLQRAYGCYIEETERYIERLGFRTYRFHDYSKSKSRIKFFISQGYPVIVAGQVRSENENHMTLLIGYDNKNSYFTLSEPQLGRIVKVQYGVFNNFHQARDPTTHCYCLIVWPK